MCLLTFMAEGVTADIDKLTEGALNNPDGFGFAVHAGSKVIRHNGMVFEQVLERFLKERAIHSGPALFHSRITTHGGTTVHNCHPFQIGRDQQSVLAHNGMLPIKEQGGRSDTRILAEDLLPSWGGVTSFDGKKFRKKISKFAQGSKLVVITANKMAQQDYYIINEQDGHWDNGVWWSNSSYKQSRYSYSGAGMYTSGWQQSSYYTGSSSYYSLPKDDSDYLLDDKDDISQLEWWTCYTCGMDEPVLIDEENFDDSMLFCPTCDSCWYCNEPRLLCNCVHNASDLSYTRDNYKYTY